VHERLSKLKDLVDPQHDAQFSIGLSGYLQGAVQPPR
jgi:hypothetical protein